MQWTIFYNNLNNGGEMEAKNNERTFRSFLLDLLFILKRNLILILVIILLSGVVGLIVDKNTTPEFTASERVIYKAEAIDNRESDPVTDVSTMFNYFATVKDFVKQGVVLDRANYYYTEYKNSNYGSVEEYISKLVDKVDKDGNVIEKGNDTYTPANRVDNVYILKNKIQIGNVVDEAFAFSIKYTDTNKTLAKEKATILAYAFKMEINMLDANDEHVYFPHLETDIMVKGIDSVSQNITTTKILLISFAIGIIVALLVVAIRTWLDNTVKDRDTLEAITGVNLLASIDFMEEN